ncbi:MAG: OmpA family protein [Nitrospirae bacterium]|nr:OmpA family protein [Nitrospirota bacterium]MBF0536266.1 OmpA family protein [Nitrospirota bacterium]MBF0615800.1 OmpA family protein [Nitrospirota bacterium]
MKKNSFFKYWLLSATIIMFITVGLSSVAKADNAAGCKAPSWASSPLTGFTITSCNDKAWATLKFDLPQGEKSVSGHRSTITYTLTDKAKTPKAADALSYYVKQAQNAGAQLVSDPGNIYKAVMTKKGPEGEFWFVYTHGGGNENSTDGFILTTVQVRPLEQEVQAQPMKAPLDPKSSTCQNPPWLVKQFSDFKLASCENKGWDVVRLDLPGGEKSVEGARVTVTYTITNEKNSPTAAAVMNNYNNALQTIGAQLVSDPNNVNHAVFTQKTPYGEFWYIYKHGSGNDDSTTSYMLTTVNVRSFEQEVQAQAMTAPLNAKNRDCQNPPWLIKQFSYFKIDNCSYRDFDSVKVDLPGGSKIIAGHVLVTNYTLTDKSRTPTPLVIKKNYQNALQTISASVVSDPKNIYYTVATNKTNLGELWYIVKHTSGNDKATGSYELITVQAGGPTPKECTLEIYGVNFDFDKATIAPGSEPVLTQVLALFNNDPQYVAEIGGHTDNIGKPAYNLKLSDERANSVKTWLVNHGVSPARLTAKGYGDTKPLVPNTTDVNRAKNRRVELKRNNCKE